MKEGMMEKWIADARLWYVARAISATLSANSRSPNTHLRFPIPVSA
jgi:hypothetical protein